VWLGSLDSDFHACMRLAPSIPQELLQLRGLRGPGSWSALLSGNTKTLGKSFLAPVTAIIVASGGMVSNEGYVIAAFGIRLFLPKNETTQAKNYTVTTMGRAYGKKLFKRLLRRMRKLSHPPMPYNEARKESGLS
jgi:hypothetical protein